MTCRMTLVIIFALSSFAVVHADWTLSIRLGSFINPSRMERIREESNTVLYCCCVCRGSTCCDSNIGGIECIENCNTRFHICAYQGSGPQRCALSRASSTGDNITFTQGRTYSDLVNPVELTVPGRLESSVSLNIDIYSSRVNSQSELGDIGGVIQSISSTRLGAAFSNSITTLTSFGLANITYAYQLRCAANYYGSNCSRLCLPNSNDTGVFICDSEGNSVSARACSTATTISMNISSFGILLIALLIVSSM